MVGYHDGSMYIHLCMAGLGFFWGGVLGSSVQGFSRLVFEGVLE